MRKVFIIALSVLLTLPTLVMAGETPEEKGKKDYSTWLPAQGDGSIGFGLNPITTFLGNIFNGTVNNQLAALAGDPMGTTGIVMPNQFVSIMGSYMMTDHWELKANAGFGFAVRSDNFYAIDDRALVLDPLSDAKVVDNKKQDNYSGSIALGAQYRLGKTRCVQGIFGFGLLYSFGYAHNKYHYGNTIGELNQTPTIAGGMGTGYVNGLVANYPALRPLEVTATAMHRIGAYGTVGIEVFVAPKISLGANVNLYLYYDFTPAVDTYYEGWNSFKNELGQYYQKVTPASYGVTFSTNNIGANLYMTFYF